MSGFAGLMLSSFNPRVATTRTAKTLTASGNAVQKNDQYKFGNSSGFFDGTGDFVSSNNSSDYSLGTGDFTLECWFRVSTLPGGYRILFSSQIDTTTKGILIGSTDTNRIYFASAISGGVSVVATNAMVINTWYHVAAVRSNGVVRLYIDGTETGTSTTDNSNYATTVARIGAQYNGGSGWRGWIDDLRLSNVARYTGNFTAPTQPLVNDSNTLLLCQFDNGDGSTSFIDSIGTSPYDPFWNNVELLITGGASNGSSTIVDTSKNGLSTNVNSGVTYSNSVTKFASTSLAFTGTTNYFGYAAQTALNSSGGNFTWEGWLYLQSGTNYPTFVAYGAYSQLLMFVNGTSGTGSWRWEMDDDGAAALDYGVAGSAPTYNQWDHYAITRASNVVRFFKNGVLMGSATTVTQNATANQALAIGSYQNAGGANYFKGYMEQIRFTKGVARYTAAFTPPTTAFPTSGS